MSRLSTFLAVCGCVLLLGPVGAQAPSGAGPWPLAEVQVEGLRRYDSAAIVRLSGLQPGTAITLADLQESANRLMQTGLFAELGFSYAVAAPGMTLTLKVEEPAWDTAVVFDNIIWMTDEVFGAELATHVPSFDGTVPEKGQANDFVAAAAEQVLAEMGITGRVEMRPRLDLRSGVTAYALAVRDAKSSLRVCDIQIPGASAISESTLLDMGSGFTGEEYSRSSFMAFTNGTLLQAYRERGFWAATFGQPAATPAPDGCQGVVVSLPVDEGVSYDVGGTRWEGVGGLEAAALDRVLNLRTGATADVRRLEEGLRAVDRLYQQHGYLQMNRSVRPEFDNEATRVTFVIAVTEEAQYRMGPMTMVGLTERQSTDVTNRWRLKTGDVFDGVYYREFSAEQSQRMGGLKIDATLHEATALVTVTFTGAR